MQLKNFITRKGKFDAGHRVMFERFECFNIHGHEYHYEMTFACAQFQDLGYAIDFKELKRIGCQWVDEHFDHGFIANPADEVMIDTCKKLQSKLYVMSLSDDTGFCNPTTENIAKELFFAISVLLNDPLEQAARPNLVLTRIKLQESINSSVECYGLCEVEWNKLCSTPLYQDLLVYRGDKGRLEYDARKLGIRHSERSELI